MHDIYDKLLREATERRDPVARCRLLLQMGHHRAANDGPSGALRCFQSALEVAVEAGDTVLEERCLEPLGLVFVHLGGVDEASACFRRLLAILEAAGDAGRAAKVRAFVGALAFRRGRLRDADRLLGDALDTMRQSDDPDAWALCYSTTKLRGAVALRQRRWLRAERLLGDALAVAEAEDQLHEVDELLADLVSAAIERGDLDTARTRLERAMDVARTLDDPVQEAVALLRLSDLDRRMERPVDGLRRVREALDRVGDLDQPELRSRATTLLGLTLRHQGNERAARSALAEAVRIARDAGAQAESDALLGFAWLAVVARDARFRDETLARRVVERALSLSPPRSRVPFVILARIARAEGDRDAVRRWRRRAQMIRDA